MLDCEPQNVHQFSMVLPWPPSVNLFQGRNLFTGQVYHKDQTRLWYREAQLLFPKVKIACVNRFEYEATFYQHYKGSPRKRDPSNSLKCLEDFLAHRFGIDDTWCLKGTYIKEFIKIKRKENKEDFVKVESKVYLVNAL